MCHTGSASCCRVRNMEHVRVICAMPACTSVSVFLDMRLCILLLRLS